MDENPLKHCNFDQIFTILGTLITLLPYWSRPNLAWDRTHSLRWHATFYLNVFTESASGGQNHNFGEILTFWGTPLPTPIFANDGQIWCARVDPWSTFTCQMSSRQVYFWLTPCENAKFHHIIDSAFCGVAKLRQSETVEHECTSTNLPLSNGIKYVSILQRLHGKIGRTISDVQNRDGQTNK